MAFKVTARTVLQLGAELISSDAVAFYELIKNSFDAGSRRVDIDVVVRIPHEQYLRHRDRFQAGIDANSRKIDASIFQALKDEIFESVSTTAPNAKELRTSINSADTWEELAKAFDDANFISVVDTGSGMTRNDLKNIYLTIGTPHRKLQREDGIEGSRPILGEKGLGRLSTMRLGERLFVETSVADDKSWNLLEIDWRWFAKSSDTMIEDIDVEPSYGDSKPDRGHHGTRIRISALTSEWTLARLSQVAIDEFSKLQDPFEPRTDYRVTLRFNDDPVAIPAMDKLLFDAAHAYVQAHFTVVSGEPRLAGKIEYRPHRRTQTFELSGAQLLSITNSALPAALLSLGPFEMNLYWFNRQILTALDGIGDRKAVQRLQARWAGGLMVFRDGFRVHPYGNPDDDWLDLDRKALASTGFKVNRRQIIGRVEITSKNNPKLLDQTNREGLRDCQEKRALISLLRHILEGQFRAFLNAVDKEIRARIPVSFDDLEDRVGSEERLIRKSMRELVQKHPEVKNDTRILSIVEESMDRLREIISQAKELAAGYDKGHTQMVYLAGLGLMVEILAHELNRATYHTLTTLTETDRGRLPRDIASAFTTLESQLKTLQKRLRILDPLSTPGRQRKEAFDLIAWVEEIVASHEAQFARHGIKWQLETSPAKRTEFRVNMVKGMIVQIMENLLSNSVYWLKQQRKLTPSMKPFISIQIDTKARTLSVTDNGPGVDPEDKEHIFEPFVTTKPPGEGKGLGLYISSEIAKYHDGSLSMSDKHTAHPDRLNTFVLELGGES